MKPKTPLLPLEAMQKFSGDFLDKERSNCALEKSVERVSDEVYAARSQQGKMSNKSIVMIQHTIAFIEKERYFNVFIDDRINHDGRRAEENTKSKANGIHEASHEKTVAVTSEHRQGQGRHGPITYKTTCFFKPKQHPVNYSETVIVNIGSKKKHYYESVYYENHLTPIKWQETVTARFPEKYNGPILKSTSNFNIKKEEFHIIAIPQPQTIEVA